MCNHEFRLYREYDESDSLNLLVYPDFEENPVYTDEGRPFVLRVAESCEYGQTDDPDGHDYGDCGGCLFFYREQPEDPIGVCMSEQRKHDQERGDI